MRAHSFLSLISLAIRKKDKFLNIFLESITTISKNLFNVAYHPVNCLSYLHINFWTTAMVQMTSDTGKD